METELLGSLSRGYHLMLLGSDDFQHLVATAEVYARVAAFLTEDTLPNIFQTQNQQAGGGRFRGSVVARNLGEMSRRLSQMPSSWADPVKSPRKIVLVFPGYEPPHKQMLATLACVDANFARLIEGCDAAARRSGISNLLDDDDDMLVKPLRAFTAQVCLADSWIRIGVRPYALIGHSLGEYAAAVVARVMTLADAFSMLALRTRLLADVSSGYRMASIDGTEESVATLVKRVDWGVAPAAFNAPGLVTVSFPAERWHDVVAQAQTTGANLVPVGDSGAGHRSDFASHMSDLIELASHTLLRQPVCPILSTVRPGCSGRDLATGQYWFDHATKPVRFTDALAASHGDCYIGVGMTPEVLTLVVRNLIRLQREGIVLIPSIQSGHDYRRQFLIAVGRAYEAGINIDLSDNDRSQGDNG